MTEEEWRKVPGFEDSYEVSNVGRVRFTKAKRGGGRACPEGIRKLVNTAATSGYNNVNLVRGDGARKTFGAHTLVALAFIGPKPPGKEVNHKDKNKINNIPENLEYVTHQRNIEHDWETGRKAPRGGRHPRASMSDDEVRRALQMIADGVPKLEVGRRFGRNRTWAYDISSRGWKHLHGTYLEFGEDRPK